MNKSSWSSLLGSWSDWTPEASNPECLGCRCSSDIWDSVLKQFSFLICPIRFDRHSHPPHWAQPLLFSPKQAFLLLWGVPYFTQDIPTELCCFQHVIARLEHPKCFSFPCEIDFLYPVSSKQSSLHLFQLHWFGGKTCDFVLLWTR